MNNPYRNFDEYGLRHLSVHLIEAELWDDLEETLYNLSFIEAKCAAGMKYDLLQDYEQAIERKKDASAIIQMRNVVSSALLYLFLHSDSSLHSLLTLQSIYNRLLWLDDLEPQLRQNLEFARLELDQRDFWLRAEGPLPDSQMSTIRKGRFEIQSSLQALSPGCEVIAIVSYNGEVEVRDLAVGKLLKRPRLNCSRIVTITVLDKEATCLAYMDTDSLIHTERSSASMRGRKGEKKLAFATGSIIAVRDDNSLIAWDPNRDVSAVLAPDLPAPLVVLRVSQDQRSVLFVAGAKNQIIGITRWIDEGWKTRTLVYSDPTVIDADIEFEGNNLLLVSMDRQLRILNIETGALLAQCSYETRESVILRGLPKKCAFGVGESLGWAFFATRNGHVACWNWKQDTLERLEDYSNISTPAQLCLFKMLPQSGDLLLTFPDQSIRMKRESVDHDKRWHSESVSGCAITSTGQIVSISKVDRTIRWYSAVGLQPQALQACKFVPTAIAPIIEGSTVLIGTKEGQVWQQPGVTPSSDKIDQIFDEPVISLFCTPNGTSVIAAKSGQVKRKDFTSDREDVLWYARESQKQYKIMPATDHGLYWSFYYDDHKGRSILSIVTSRDHQEIVREFPLGLSDVVISSDGSTLCLVGESVEVWQSSRGKWTPIFYKDVRVKHAVFLNDGSLLAVVLRTDPWLEIWHIAENLPTLAAHEIPGKVTCLAASGDIIAVGLSSGKLISLRLCRGE